jgi:iron complex outermembrane receptor protein
MKRICRLAVWVGIACLTVSANLLAQQLRITGMVSDGTGAVPNAAITLRNPSGMTSQGTTNDVGQYRFEGLRPGAYEITVNREGFIPATRSLTLVAESKTVDITLEVGGVVTSIDVTDVAGRATAAGMDIPNREVPNYVVTVTSRTLQEQGINNLRAALENISGVTTQVQYGVYEWYTIGGITQQSGNDFLYVDGMTLTGNRSATQLNNIEEIQVLKGPNAILYGGSGAGQGGMVNLIRKKPQFAPVHDIQYRLGRWGLQEVAFGTAGSVAGLQRLLYRVDTSYSHQDGWRQTGSNRFNVAPSITWLINSKMRFNTTQTIIRDRYTLDAGLRKEIVNRPGIPLDLKLNPDADFQLTRDWQNQMTFSWNVTNRLTLTNTFFKRRNRDQYLDAETMAYDAANDRVTRAYLYFQHNRRPVENIVDAAGDYTVLGMRHRFLARYDYSDQYNFTNRTGSTPGTSNSTALPLPPVPLSSFIARTFVDTAPTYTNFPITRVDFSDNRYHGVVLQDQVNPVRWFGFNFTISRRNYHRNTHNDNYDNGNFVSPGAETKITNNTKSNYRAGGVLIPQENWPLLLRGIQPYFSYNSSFNPVNSISADGRVLDPVLNKSFEIGNKWQGLNSRLTVLTAVRRIQDKNRVVSLGAGLFDQVQLGHGISLLTNWGYADSKIEPFKADGTPQTNGGKRFPHAPKHMTRVWLTKSVKVNDSTRLSVSLGQRYEARYFADTANTAIVPSHSTMDGAVTLRRAKYDVTVNFANITNKQHYFVSQINSGGQLYPGEPFNAKMTVGYHF